MASSVIGSTSTPWYGEVPDWILPPQGDGLFGSYTMALEDFTNPLTGETWTAPHGGYSLNPELTTLSKTGEMIGVGPTPTTNEYGFTRIQGPHAQVVMDYYNPTTGQTFSGTGWEMPENSDWRVGRPGDNDLAQTTTPSISMDVPSTTAEIIPLPDTTPTTGLFNGNLDWLQSMFNNTTQPVVDPGWNAAYTLQQNNNSNYLQPFYNQQQDLTPNPNPVWGAPSYYRPEPEAWWQKSGMLQGQTPWWESSYSNLPIFTNPTTGQTEPTPGTQVPIDTSGVSSDGDSSFPDTSSPYDQYGEQADWYQAYDFLNMSPWEKGLLGLIPGAKLLSAATQYSLGINPFAAGLNKVADFFGLDQYTPIFMEGYSGPGSVIGNEWGLAPGEQLDMLIGQQWDMFDTPEEAREFYAQEYDLNNDGVADSWEDAIGSYNDFLDAYGGNALAFGPNGNMSDWTFQEFMNEFSLDDSFEDTTPEVPTADNMTVGEALDAGLPFGQQGDDTWSPGGGDVFHGPGYNWNNPVDTNAPAVPTTPTTPTTPTAPTTPSTGDGGYTDSESFGGMGGTDEGDAAAAAAGEEDATGGWGGGYDSNADGGLGGGWGDFGGGDTGGYE